MCVLTNTPQLLLKVKSFFPETTPKLKNGEEVSTDFFSLYYRLLPFEIIEILNSLFSGIAPQL